MKKISFLLLFLSGCASYSQDVLWEKSLGGKNAEYLFDAIPTPDYGFILAGSSSSGKGGNKADKGKGNFDYWVWKMSEKGDLDWQKSFGGSGDDHLQRIQITNDGGFILGGISNSPNDGDKKEGCKGDSDYWIIKLNAKGDEIWQKTIGGNGQESLQAILQTVDGGYIIGGTSGSDKTMPDEKSKEDKFGKAEDSKGNLDYWIVKLDKAGEIEWQKSYGGMYADELKNIEQTKDGGYIVGGYSNSPLSGDKDTASLGDGDFWILKLDKKGALQWQKTIGGDKDDNLFTLSQTKDGGYIAGGNSNSGAGNSKAKSNGKGTDFWVVKLDEEGVIAWQETYDFGKSDVLTSIVENSDGTYLIGGYAQSEKSLGASKNNKNKSAASDKKGINDYIALKISKIGEKIWAQEVGSNGDEVMQKLIETRDGGYVLVGTSNGEKSRDKDTKMGDSDFWVVKLKDKTKSEKNDKVYLEAFPNPATTDTNAIINYDYTYGTATLYDLSGREIKAITLHGEHTIPIELGNIPQGVYVIKVATSHGEHSVKVIKK